MRRNCKSFKSFVSKPELNEKDCDQDAKHEEDGRRRLTKASSNAQSPQGRQSVNNILSSWTQHDRALHVTVCE